MAKDLKEEELGLDQGYDDNQKVELREEVEGQDGGIYEPDGLVSVAQSGRYEDETQGALLHLITLVSGLADKLTC